MMLSVSMAESFKDFDGESSIRQVFLLTSAYDREKHSITQLP